MCWFGWNEKNAPDMLLPWNGFTVIVNLARLNSSVDAHHRTTALSNRLRRGPFGTGAPATLRVRAVSRRSETPARKVKADAGVEIVLAFAVMHLIVSAFRPIERENTLDPEVAAFLRIEIEFAVRPAGGKAGAIVEGRVHLEVAAVMLDLIAPAESPRVVAVGYLCADSVRLVG